MAGEELASLETLDVPTGAGKTEAVLLSWLWNRVHSQKSDWPRRLVYCLPMRVLVEQTRDRAGRILDRLVQAGHLKKGTVGLHVLMGGEDADVWDIQTEREAIIIGTQDMLISRALNRGFGTSRYRWPVQFGLLNNDVLWVADEIQLMGAGLPTTCQLQAFRETLGTFGPTKSIWMSATLDPRWLKTVDFDVTNVATGRGENAVRLTDEDLRDTRLAARMNAPKALHRSDTPMGDIKPFVSEVTQAHRRGSLTMVILNTVPRAQDVARELRRRNPNIEVVLLHSRFRPPDRKRALDRLLSPVEETGRIGVCTQVVEAGVDISARTLFTEVAPYASMVQRFGRGNRTGIEEDAAIYWLDLPDDSQQAQKLSKPYEVEALRWSASALSAITNASPQLLRSAVRPPYESPGGQVLRRKDVLELFDTTPDLSGHDTDISRFVRESDQSDLTVFWRDLGAGPPDPDAPAPERDELCPVPIGEMKELVQAGTTHSHIWDFLEGTWSPLRRGDPLHPGSVVLLDATEGHYTPEEGWNRALKPRVPVIPAAKVEPSEGDDADPRSFGAWMDLAEHTDQVVTEARRIVSTLSLPEWVESAVLNACRWHDAGKAHPAFQANINPTHSPPPHVKIVAKAPKDAWRKGRPPGVPIDSDHRRRHFRHELVSGLMAMKAQQNDLVVFLIAAHHGKVRLSIRSLPGEMHPKRVEIRFARGVWEGDNVPSADLGGGVSLRGGAIDLSPIELGQGINGQSWASRMLALRDQEDLGPFRLAFLEALVKAADETASRGST
jgi:CRISPR-associated endonuclease/helicase Cas3